MWGFNAARSFLGGNGNIGIPTITYVHEWVMRKQSLIKIFNAIFNICT